MLRSTTGPPLAWAGGVTRNATYDARGQTAIVTNQDGLVHFIR